MPDPIAMSRYFLAKPDTRIERGVRTTTGRTCPQCGSSDYAFRSRKAMKAEAAKDVPWCFHRKTTSPFVRRA